MTRISRSNSSGSATMNSSVQAIKLCRLCEAKDGPFLNIFDADMDLAEKIDTLLPIMVTEYDDLPHKVCFRCSAKLTDLHEFVNKCIQTQERLCKTLNKTLPKLKSECKTKSKKLWADRLTKNKLCNSVYCEELVRKALKSMGKNFNESIKGKFSLPVPDLFSSTVSNLNESKDNNKIDFKINDNEKRSSVEEKRDTSDIKLSINNNSRKDCNKDIDRHQSTDGAHNRIGSKSAKTLMKPTAGQRNDQAIANANKNQTVKILQESYELKNFIVEENNDMGISNANKNQTVKDLQKSKELKNMEKTKDFEKDIRVCISRVNSKDSSRETQYEVKQDSSITKKNVSALKVAGVGTVYSCEDCNRIFLNKDRIPIHKCVTDKSKIIKEVIEKNNTRVPNNDITNLGKTVPKGQKSLDSAKEGSTDNTTKKVPGPASKTINKVTEKSNSNSVQSPSLDSLTIDSIMKNLIGNQMHYQLIQGPNNTLTLQATPQAINIPINVIQPHSLPMSSTTDSNVISQNKKSDLQSQAKVIVDYPTPAIDSMRHDIAKNSTSEQLPTFSRKRGRSSRIQVSQPIDGNEVAKSQKNSVAESLNNINVKKPEQVQKEIPSLKVKSVLPIKSSSSTRGPFPVALAKNIYLSNATSEPPPIVIDDSPNTRENKRKSKDLAERSKKLKINPEIIELDDDTESVAQMDDLLEERPIVTRGRGRGKAKSNPIKLVEEVPIAPQSYRVVPNNNPRKLIISAVGSAPLVRKGSNKTKNATSKRNSSNKYSANSSSHEDNVAFFTHLGEEDCSETVIPDRTVVQESQITTTVSTRPSKGRGSNTKESIGTQKCMMCNMSFSDNAKLSAHMKIHYANWI